MGTPLEVLFSVNGVMLHSVPRNKSGGHTPNISEFDLFVLGMQMSVVEGLLAPCSYSELCQEAV